jgi:hypothetical protein
MQWPSWPLGRRWVASAYTKPEKQKKKNNNKRPSLSFFFSSMNFARFQEETMTCSIRVFLCETTSPNADLAIGLTQT